MTTSVAEADACEAKVDLMEGVLAKLKVGTQEVYGLSQCGATPVLNLLGDQRRATQGGAPRSMQPEQGKLYSGNFYNFCLKNPHKNSLKNARFFQLKTEFVNSSFDVQLFNNFFCANGPQTHSFLSQFSKTSRFSRIGPGNL